MWFPTDRSWRFFPVSVSLVTLDVSKPCKYVIIIIYNTTWRILSVLCTTWYDIMYRVLYSDWPNMFIPSFRYRDNSVHLHECSPFWVGIFITVNIENYRSVKLAGYWALDIGYSITIYVQVCEAGWILGIGYSITSCT